MSNNNDKRTKKSGHSISNSNNSDGDKLRDLVKRRRDSEKAFDESVKKLKLAHTMEAASLSHDIDIQQDRVLADCMLRARQGRQDYLDNYESIGGFIFHATPPQQKPRQQEAPMGGPVLLTLLALRNENFASIIFPRLGAMELFNVYRTCRAMRRALHHCLRQCVMAVIDCDCNPTLETEKAKWVNSMEFALIEYNDIARGIITSDAGTSPTLSKTHDNTMNVDEDCDDTHHIIPHLLRLTSVIHRHLRPYGDINLRGFGWTSEELDLYAMVVVSDDRPFPRVTPLVEYNLFACKYPSSINSTKVASQRRYRQLYGDQFVRSDGYNDLDLFDHTDCLALELQPVTEESLRVSREKRSKQGPSTPMPPPPGRLGKARTSRDDTLMLGSLIIVNREAATLHGLRTTPRDPRYENAQRPFSVARVLLPVGWSDCLYWFDRYELRIRVSESLEHPTIVKPLSTTLPAEKMPRPNDAEVTRIRTAFDLVVAKVKQAQEQGRDPVKSAYNSAQKTLEALYSARLDRVGRPWSFLDQATKFWCDEETGSREPRTVSQKLSPGSPVYNPTSPCYGPSSPVYRSPIRRAMDSYDSDEEEQHPYILPREAESQEPEWLEMREKRRDTDSDSNIDGDDDGDDDIGTDTASGVYYGDDGDGIL